jgi:hypothetical protein
VKRFRRVRAAGLVSAVAFAAAGLAIVLGGSALPSSSAMVSLSPDTGASTVNALGPLSFGSRPALEGQGRSRQADGKGSVSELAASASGVQSTVVPQAWAAGRTRGDQGYTGADAEATIAGGIALICAGSILVIFARRRDEVAS